MCEVRYFWPIFSLTVFCLKNLSLYFDTKHCFFVDAKPTEVNYKIINPY